MNLIKPNKAETIVITIMISAVIGFALGVSSASQELKEKDKQINELLNVVEVLLK